LQDGPVSEEDLVAEAEKRYGWKDRRARDYIASLLKLTEADGIAAIREGQQGHKKILTLLSLPVATPTGEVM
jgi:hypothetical protein